MKLLAALALLALSAQAVPRPQQHPLYAALTRDSAKQCAGIDCPGGCCEFADWFCCDQYYCATFQGDCPSWVTPGGPMDEPIKAAVVPVVEERDYCTDNGMVNCMAGQPGGEISCCPNAGFTCCENNLNYCALDPADCALVSTTAAPTVVELVPKEDAVDERGPICGPTLGDCPTGCCPFTSWVCCPDMKNCANDLSNCPAPPKEMPFW